MCVQIKLDFHYFDLTANSLSADSIAPLPFFVRFLKTIVVELEEYLQS